LRIVETAAMHRPQFATHARIDKILALRRQQVIVEPDEIERRADPRDAGDQMRPAAEQGEPVEQVRVHARNPVIARSTASGVAGAGRSGSVRWSAHDATASRIARNVEIHNINGGSPTALER